MTHATTTPAPTVDWSAVTLAEFAALDLLRRVDGLDALHRYWNHVHDANPFRGETPTRLSADGLVWRDGLVAAATTGTDRDQLDAAREYLRTLGRLAIMGAHRMTMMTATATSSTN